MQLAVDVRYALGCSVIVQRVGRVSTLLSSSSSKPTWKYTSASVSGEEMFCAAFLWHWVTCAAIKSPSFSLSGN